MNIPEKWREYISLTMQEVAKEAALLLYAPGADLYFDELIKNADRVLYFDEEPRADMKLNSKSYPTA